ncbi:protein of unknown function [Vibrio tapetis subsp. tapetis]|uniref:Uncharacterized protein n=1 Tax=Vibrio tapetis subsp. tapetis TaxID=1671868 RepID=A0A2N8ZIG6_9VIBR|nr:protein of unknown function [Vibrio tapetis subsp. tapetis]
MVESTGLENRQSFVAALGFKSLSLHQFEETANYLAVFFRLEFEAKIARTDLF